MNKEQLEKYIAGITKVARTDLFKKHNMAMSIITEYVYRLFNHHPAPFYTFDKYVSEGLVVVGLNDKVTFIDLTSHVNAIDQCNEDNFLAMIAQTLKMGGVLSNLENEKNFKTPFYLKVVLKAFRPDEVPVPGQEERIKQEFLKIIPPLFEFMENHTLLELRSIIQIIHKNSTLMKGSALSELFESGVESKENNPFSPN